MAIYRARRLEIAAAFIAAAGAFPILSAWRISRAERTPQQVAAPAPVVTTAAATPVRCEDAAVRVDRFSTDLSIAFLTPAYAERIDGLPALEQLARDRGVNLDKVKEFLSLARQDQKTVNVRRLAEVHAE